MGHYINGFIASLDQLSEAARRVAGARICPLQLGFAFLPLTAEVSSLDDPAADHDAFYRLTEPILEWAKKQSHRFPIAYIETDYFGGVGSQSAIVWRNGEIIFGPLQTADVAFLSDGAISRALRALGVARRNAIDEFDELGLGSYRDNEDWVEAVGKPAA
jgi:hypothetical protein